MVHLITVVTKKLRQDGWRVRMGWRVFLFLYHREIKDGLTREQKKEEEGSINQPSQRELSKQIQGLWWDYPEILRTQSTFLTPCSKGSSHKTLPQGYAS